jgi:hypothetical protein
MQVHYALPAPPRLSALPSSPSFTRILNSREERELYFLVFEFEDQVPADHLEVLLGLGVVVGGLGLDDEVGGS